MPTLRHAPWLVLVLLAGCQSRLNDERTYELTTGDIKTMSIPGPRYQQKVTVTVNSDAPVDVYAYLDKDKDKVEKALDSAQKPEQLLASQERMQDGSLEFTLPAKEGGVVRIVAPFRPTKVKIKLSGA